MAPRYPTFLILKSDVTLRNRVGIVENENGGFKANIVLAKILSVLVLVPYESHSRRRQDSISAEMKDANTFVRTSWLRVALKPPPSNVGESAGLSTTLLREIAVSQWLFKSRINKGFWDKSRWP
jgi:hypothetical protein